MNKTNQLLLSFNHTETVPEMIRILRVAKANLSIAKMNLDFLLTIHGNKNKLDFKELEIELKNKIGELNG